MMLFRVYKKYGKDSTVRYDEKFIVAQGKQLAINKWLKINRNNIEGWHIVAEEICNRDEIIPTVDPIKEFTTITIENEIQEDFPVLFGQFSEEIARGLMNSNKKSKK